MAVLHFQWLGKIDLSNQTKLTRLKCLKAPLIRYGENTRIREGLKKMEQEKMNLMHEVLTHRYYPFYLSLPNNREMAMKLHELGYINDGNGQPTEVAQKF